MGAELEERQSTIESECSMRYRSSCRLARRGESRGLGPAVGKSSQRCAEGLRFMGGSERECRRLARSAT